MRSLIFLFLLAAGASALAAEPSPFPDPQQWTYVDRTPLNFATFHPQGLTRVGEHWFLSSVQIIERSAPYPQPVDGLDRSAGRGRGLLFKFDGAGELVDSVELGDGDSYHPGGIDYDGEHLWIPVAEYRPDSAAILYRVRPDTLAFEEVLRVDDHIGGLIRHPETGDLHGVSWGSRRYYQWSALAGGEFATQPQTKLNGSFYVDYQDCQWQPNNRMLCSGLNRFYGGIELVDLASKQPVWQRPVTLRARSGELLTRNPFYFEETEAGRSLYFVPEDNQSHLYHYRLGEQ